MLKRELSMLCSMLAALGGLAAADAATAAVFSRDGGYVVMETPRKPDVGATISVDGVAMRVKSVDDFVVNLGGVDVPLHAVEVEAPTASDHLVRARRAAMRELGPVSRVGYLVRRKDHSGVSGTGVVAMVFKHSHGVTVHWLGATQSFVIYADVNAMIRVHGHGGDTTVVWAHGGGDG